LESPAWVAESTQSVDPLVIATVQPDGPAIAEHPPVAASETASVDEVVGSTRKLVPNTPVVTGAGNAMVCSAFRTVTTPSV
jgi:hypothetical protein